MYVGGLVDELTRLALSVYPPLAGWLFKIAI
jgi:hypothetical protein